MVDHNRAIGDAEHLGNRKPPDVGVDHSDLLPRRLKATARLVVTDDFPTPPLPDETAITRVGDPLWPDPRARRIAQPGHHRRSGRRHPSRWSRWLPGRRPIRRCAAELLEVRVVGDRQRDGGLEAAQQALFDRRHHRQFADGFDRGEDRSPTRWRVSGRPKLAMYPLRR